MPCRCPRDLPRSALVTLLSLPLAALPAAAEISPDGLWSELEVHRAAALDEPEIATARHRPVLLDPPALDALLAIAPREGSLAARFGEPVELTLPLPDGGFGRFQVEESPIMEPELAAKFPQLATYRGVGIDDPAATLRFSVTPHGFHAQVLSPSGRFFVDPHARGDRYHHQVYFGRDARRPEGVDFRCEVHGELERLPDDDPIPKAATAVDLRIYRTAVAATGEYTTYHSGPAPPNVADGMAAIVIAMNRVNGVYEREVAIRMVLVANNDLVVYTDPATDPYTNNSGGTMLGQNQSNLDAVIGNANYDIGHVFSTGGGGVANLGVPCRTGWKARGVTGLPNPIGDVFWVDYVAHEMGHQWGANHTFNGSSGSCSGGNRNGPTAFEPGSGSTIMAYAGICSPQNTQLTSDDYFHLVSLQEIVAYSRNGLGNTCASPLPVGNAAPVAEAPPGGTIPIHTPFALCGGGSDPDGDPVTFNWEQWDLGAAGHPSTPAGNAPIFRTFQAVVVPERVLPRWSDILGNTQTLGEILPSYTRTLNFRLTVRDGGPVAGAFGIAATQVPARAEAGPFAVTAPNTGSVTWTAGEIETVTWDPAGTAAPPVGCPEVDILLSDDGGASFAWPLATAVPNEGLAFVAVPPVASAAARILVRCAGVASGIFFDVSDAEFTIAGAVAGGAPPRLLGGGGSGVCAELATLARELEAAPEPVDFGEVTVGATSAALAVTLANPGAGTLTVTAVEEPGGAFAAAGGTCGATPFGLGPGGSCTLEYTFSPPTAGWFEATVAVTTDATAGADGFGLQGVGLSTPEIFFGDFETGDTSPWSATQGG
jgi:hypothetical protein